MYKRQEYKSDVFYLRIQSPGGEEGEQDLLKPQQSRSAPILKDGKHPIPGDEEPRECLMRNLPFDPDKARVVGEVKITEVTSVYLEALHNECEVFYAKNSDALLGVKVKTSEKTDLRMGLEKTPAGGLGPKGSFNLKF